jgi:hypothetical protein
MVSKLYKEPDSDQIQTLIYCMGAVEASKICSMFKYEGTFKKKVVQNGNTEIKDIQQRNTDYDCVPQNDEIFRILCTYNFDQI